MKRSKDIFGVPSLRVLAMLTFVLAVMSTLQPAFAQSATSADLRGSVTSAGGDPVVGAEVIITHQPSGTRAQAQTNDSGNFFQRGLRVGGPYVIEVAAEGFQARELSEIYLQPGSQPPVEIDLQSDTIELDAVAVSGTSLAGKELNNGVGSSYSSEDISNQPATDRDVIKTLLNDPLAQSSGEGNLSVAGVNPRFNGLAIDGSLQQDDFGLGDNTYATERSPINLDAVESASLVAADYSVTASGFTGGLVNVVTKSGGNEFDGSVFYYYQDEDFLGDSYGEDGERDFTAGAFEEEEYGFTLGGPIVKDKLFFFVSYDEYESASSVDFTDADATNGVQPGFFQALNGIIQDTYGYDALGRPNGAATPVTTERALAKIDWNINYDHRASFTYQSTEESGTSVGSTEFESAWYDIPVDLEAYTAQLFSDWSYNFSTTLRFNYKDFVRGQNCRAGSDVAHFEFRLDENDVAGTPLEGLLTDSNTFTAGCDRFRHANEYNDDRMQIFAAGDYYLGDHTINFGTEYEEFNVFNVFVAGSNGRYVFDTFEQIINRTPNNVDYVNVPTNNSDDGAANWGYEKLSFFVQDTWQMTPDFELSYGLRYEEFMQDDEPAFSQDIFDTYGVRTDNNIDGLDLLMPRVGFFWQPAARTTVTGGFGLFAGGDPKVWISNSFQAPTVFARSTSVTDASFTGAVPQDLLDAVAAGNPAVIDYISDDFETPSDWKASLRVDQSFDMNFGGFDLGDDYNFSAQYLHTRTNDGFLWTNIAQTELDAALPTGVAPDGRTIYADLDDLGILNLTELGNFSDGRSHVFTLALNKSYDFGLDWSVAYAHQDVEAVTEGTSSRGISNWRGIVSTDRNDPSATTSPYQVEDAFKIKLGYQQNFFGDLTTRVDLFGQISSGTPFTYTFNVDSDNSLFGRAGAGESPFDNNPLYIPDPSGDALVVYGSQFDEQAFFDYIAQNGIPTGRIHEVRSAQSSWNQRWDLRFQQELPGIPGMDGLVGDNKLSLVLDIENVLNLLNDEWGNVSEAASFGQLGIVRADLVSAADVAANGIDGATALTGDAPRTACQSAGDCVYRYNDFDADPSSFLDGGESVYRIRLGIRYDF